MEDTEVLTLGTMDNLKLYQYQPKFQDKFKVTQAFCSAVSLDSLYNEPDEDNINILAKAILDAQYEAVLWLAVKNACDVGKNSVFLT